MLQGVPIPAWLRGMCLVLCGLMGTLQARAQADTLQLGAVEIFAERFARVAAGFVPMRLAPERLPVAAAQSIHFLLEMQSPALLRGYGPGSSYGLSVQGASVAQSQLMINGIPFDNPSLAQADLSLLPTLLFSDVSLLQGGAGALLGNAAMAGTLFLDHKLRESDPRALVNLSAGSFGERGSTAALRYGRSRLQGRTMLYFREADNDFIRTLPGGLEEPQPDAHFRSRGLQQSLSYQSESGWQVEAMLWYGEVNRSIPPTLSQARSHARQEDANLRAQARLRKRFGRVLLTADAAHDAGFLRFSDRNVDDTSSFGTQHVQVEVATKTGRTALSTMVIYRHSSAFTANYANKATREMPALVMRAGRSFFEDRTEVSAAMRIEWLDGSALPVVPTLGVSHALSQKWKLEGHAGRVYRVPGLNDLYWSPGGQPNLLPESGWSQQLGLRYVQPFGEKQRSGKHKPSTQAGLELSMSGFNRQVEHWIIWLPGAGYWEPRNLRRVWSRGMEARATARHSTGTLCWQHRFALDYQRSTTEESLNPEDRALGKQLIYTPLWAGMWEERLLMGPWEGSATLQYRSERFSTADNSRSLEPYILMHAQVQYNWQVKNHAFNLGLVCMNLLNTDYMQVLNRPLPGRHFLINLQYTLK